MKLKITIALAVTLLFLLMGCNTHYDDLEENNEQNEMELTTSELDEEVTETEENTNEISEPDIVDISNLIPAKYSSKEAVKNGDVVNLHGTIYNIEILNEFIENVEDGTKDEIRITQYTIEGDPIFTILEYDGEVITLNSDNTRDKFGSPNRFTKQFEKIKMIDFVRDKREMAKVILESAEEDMTIMMYYKE